MATALVITMLPNNKLFAGSGDLPETLSVEIHRGGEVPSAPSGTEAETRTYEAKSLQAMVGELMRFNPELKALTEKVYALEERVPQAGALDDPRFEFALRNFQIRDFDPNADFMSGFELGMRQKVPGPGKLKLKKKIAQSRTEQEKAEYLEKLNQLVAKFKGTYYEYQFVSEAAQIYQGTLARLGGLSQILASRYSSGDTPQQDILKNKVEISNIQDTLIQLREKKNILEARLNALLYRPAGTPLKITTGREPLTPLKISLENLRELAKRNRPWLKKSDLKIEEADYQTRLAKKGLLPDFDFGAGYMIRTDGHPNPNDNRDMVTLGFSMTLPVFAGKKQNRAIQEAIHMKKMEEYLKAATSREVELQVEQLFHEIKQLDAQVRLLSSRSIPQSAASVDSSKVNYQADETDFLNVLTGEISLLNQKIQRVQYRYDYEKKIAELEMAVGIPVAVMNQMEGELDGTF